MVDQWVILRRHLLGKYRITTEKCMHYLKFCPFPNLMMLHLALTRYPLSFLSLSAQYIIFYVTLCTIHIDTYMRHFANLLLSMVLDSIRARVVSTKRARKKDFSSILFNNDIFDAIRYRNVQYYLFIRT